MKKSNITALLNYTPPYHCGKMPLTTDIDIHTDYHDKNHNRDFLTNLGCPIRKYLYEERERFNNILEMELHHNQKRTS